MTGEQRKTYKFSSYSVGFRVAEMKETSLNIDMLSGKVFLLQSVPIMNTVTVIINCAAATYAPPPTSCWELPVCEYSLGV